MNTRSILLGSGALALIALVAVGTTHWQTRNRLALDYVVTHDPENPELAEVRLQVRHLGAGRFGEGEELILGLQVQDLYRASGPVWIDGKRVEGFREETRQVGQNWKLTRYRVWDRGEDFEVRYQARIGAKEGKASKGFTGIRVGIAEPDLWVALGASLFLYPIREPGRVAEVSVRIENRSGFPLHTPWPERDGTFYPEVKGADGPDSLLTSSIWIGPAERTVLPLGEATSGSVLEVVASERIAQATREEVVTRIGEIAERLYAIFQPAQMERLVIFITPRDAEGYDLLTPRSGRQVSVSLDPPTPSRWRHLSKSLTDVFVRRQPYRREVRSPEDFWLALALPRYFGEKSLDWIGMPGFKAHVEKAEQSLRQEDTMVLADVHSMELRYVNEVTAFFGKSVAVLDRIDRKLIAESEGEHSLADALHAYFVEGRSRSLLGVLEDLLPAAEAEVVASWITETQEPTTELDGQAVPVHLDRSRSQIPESFDHHLRIVHVARQRNFLENCGCKTNQNGGVARLAAEVERLRREDPGLLLVNGGDAFPVEKGERLPRPMTREESRLGLDLLEDLEFDSLNIGLSELLYGADYFRAATAEKPLPYLSSDLSHDGSPMAPPVRVVERTGLSIGLMGLSADDSEDSDTVVFEDGRVGMHQLPSEEALDAALATLADHEIDLVVLFCNLYPDELAPLLEGRDIDLVLTSALPQGSGAHTFGETYFLGKTAVVHSDIGPYGYIATDLYLEAGKPLAASSQAIQLTEDMPEAGPVRERLDAFYRTVADRLETTRYLDLWTHEVQSAEWVGAKTCSTCHPGQFEQWSQTAHASAFPTLVKKRRQYYPNCVECHVTGFDLANGFRMAQGAASPWLGVQCEMCHGPGSRHVRAPTDHTLLREPEIGICRSCHNEEHSDMTASNFSEYYEKVVH